MKLNCFFNLYLLFMHITEWNNSIISSTIEMVVVLWRNIIFVSSHKSPPYRYCTRKRQLLLVPSISILYKEKTTLACLGYHHSMYTLSYQCLYLHTIGTSSASLTRLICQVNKKQSLYIGKICISFNVLSPGFNIL